MLRINCPFCGTRDELEFSFGGESHLTRPGLDASDEEWADYLFNKRIQKASIMSNGCTASAADAGLMWRAIR